MSDNDFEKAVQQDLDELSLSPSDVVWKKVEATLPQKKRRRWILFLIPVLLGAAFIWYGEVNEVYKVDEVKKVYKVDKVYTGEVGEVKKVYKVDKVYKGDEGDEGEVNEVNKVDKVYTGKEEEREIADKTSKVNKVDKGDSEGIDIKSKEDFIAVKSSGTKTGITNQSKKVSKQPNADVAAGSTGSSTKLNTNVPPAENFISQQDKSGEPMNPDYNQEKELSKFNDVSPVHTDTLSSANTVKSVIEIPDINTNTDTTNKTSQAKKDDNKNKTFWKFGLLAGAGISNIGDGLFNNTEKSLYDPASWPMGGTGGQPSVQVEPSSSFSFTIGAYAEKEINRKLSFVAGLGYAYYSNIIKLQRVDSILYAGDGKKYTNKYHFIQLPVTLQYIPFSKLPVYIEAGLNASYLIKSNALQYNSTNNRYTKNTTGYTRFLIGMNAGLGANINNVKIGYRLSYSLTSLSNESVKQFPYSSMIYLQVPLKKH